MKVKALKKILNSLDPEKEFKFQLADYADAFNPGEVVHLEEVRRSTLLIRIDDKEAELDSFLQEEEPIKLILI